MADITPNELDARADRLPLAERLVYAVPLLGWMLKDVVHGDKDNIWYFLATIVMLWILAAMTFGYAGIIIPALVAVPVVFTFLLLITRG